MKKLLPLLLILTIWSCGAKKDEAFRYWVNSYTVPCDDNPSLQCLLIQKNDVIDPRGWQNFSGTIEGFVFEPEFMVKMRVSETMEGTETKLAMVEELSKERDPRFNINEIWVVIAIDGAPFDVPADAEAPFLEVNLRQHKILGTDGCNTYNGSIKSLTANSIELGEMISTQKACPNLDYPNKFLTAFQAADNYKVENGILIMSEGETERLRLKHLN